MIKVLYLRSSFDSGGTETLLLNFFNIKQEQIQINLVLIKGGELVAQLNNKYNNYYEIYRKRVVDMQIVFKLFKIIRGNKIKVVHTHQEIELFYAVLLKILLPSIKIFHTIHLMNPSFDMLHYLERFLIIFAHKVITVSNSLLNFQLSKGYPPRKLLTIYNAVSLPESVNLFEIEKFKKRINFTIEDFVIIMIGNFRSEKDQLTVIKAFNLLRLKHCHIKLIFLGKENSESLICRENTFKEDLDQRVFYVGSLPKAYMYLTLASLFVLASKSETFCIAVIESLLMKVPVLASDIPVMHELSKEGEYFELFTEQNAFNLAENVERYLDVKYNLSILTKVEDAYNYAIRSYSYDNFVIKLLEVYNG